MASISTSFDRTQVIQRGKYLQYLTIGWNCLEAVIAIGSGIVAGSIALVGFGFDSVIEVTSGAAVLWRLQRDHHHARREQMEKLSLRIVAICFLALAVYVTYESIEALIDRTAPQRSIVGIVLAALSLIVMPLLTRAKRRVAAALDSRSMSADAKQTEFCAYLSAILLGGLLLNAAFGWWWADPVAGLVMVPIIVKEGVDGLRGKACGCGSSC